MLQNVVKVKPDTIVYKFLRFLFLESSLSILTKQFDPFLNRGMGGKKVAQ